MTSITNFEHFPSEIVLEIFSFLQLNDLVRCNQVNKRWQDLSKDNCLWNSIYKQYFSWLEIPSDSNIKEFLDKFLVNQKIVKSCDEMLDSLDHFVKKVQLNQLGMVSCKFPFDPEFSFWTKIAVLEKNFTDELDFSNPHLKKECIFIKKLEGTKEYVSMETNSNVGRNNIFLKGIHIKLPKAFDMSMFNRALKIVENRIDELEENSKKI